MSITWAGGAEVSVLVLYAGRQEVRLTSPYQGFIINYLLNIFVDVLVGLGGPRSSPLRL